KVDKIMRILCFQEVQPISKNRKEYGFLRSACPTLFVHMYFQMSSEKNNNNSNPRSRDFSYDLLKDRVISKLSFCEHVNQLTKKDYYDLMKFEVTLRDVINHVKGDKR